MATPDGRIGAIDARTFVIALVAIALLGATLRFVFPTADPPWRSPVGIVWHDEGTWVHNARNKVLFGDWRQDQWNPLFIAPVFTALEYASFATFGVGVRQARLVSEITGLLSVVLLGLGVARLAGRPAGLVAAALLATNYVYVMYNRAALMEASMAAFMVYSWYCFVRAQTQPAWGLAAGAAALLAYFTKAAAVFFVGALGLVALVGLVEAGSRAGVGSGSSVEALRQRASLATLLGLVLAGLAALLLFVGPHWTEYWFYNWQVSVVRKPSYDFKSLMDRASWYPILHDFFTRMWLLLVVTSLALVSAFGRWREREPGERLLHAWILIGSIELVLHDVGNERRLVFLIPAMAALSALVLARDRQLLATLTSVTTRQAILVAPLVMYLLYMIWGALVRLAFVSEIRPSVRWAALLAFVTGSFLVVMAPRIVRALPKERWSLASALLVTGLMLLGDVSQFTQWAVGRSYKNFEASIALGERLPPGTLVHGKLSNGLALENQIRPIFVGRGFGNYEDRLNRNDIRYVLTYTAPRLGYEGPVILDVLAAYPQRRTLWSFDVAETATGFDRAALFDKNIGAADANSTSEDHTARARR